MAILALAWSIPAAAQQVGSLTGRVTDATTGYALSGAQIFVQELNIGALADAEGRYRLSSVPAGSHRVSVLLLGYGTQTRTVDLANDETIVLDFALQPTAIALDEIVVTATGERRKRELGNAIADIQAGDLVQAAPITNAFDLLQARAPGVQVLSTGGGAGIGSRIRIRGSNSLSLSNEPIVYLDGIRIESGAGAIMGTGGQDLGRLNDLNPEEIESVEIVKGPSAATLYGTEAANGVIRITTKRGTAGPPRWSFYAEGGAVWDPYTYPDNYIAFDEAGAPCLLRNQLAGLCQIETVSHYQPLEDERFTFMGTGWRQQYGLTVSGGADRVNYFVSGEWEEEVGPYDLKGLYRQRLDSLGIGVKETTARPQQLHKLSLRANLSVNLADNAVFSMNTGWVGSTTALTFNDNTQYAAVRLGYLGGAVRPESGEYDSSTWYGGRSPEMLFAEDFFQDVGRFTLAARLDWSPFRWLDIRGVAGMDEVRRDETDHLPRGLWPDNPVMNDGYRWLADARILQQTLDLGATGNFRLSPSLLSGTSLGVQFLRKLDHWHDLWGFDLSAGAETVSALSRDKDIREATGESRTLGVFLEEQLSWNDRLFLTGAIRMDDNSTFGKDFDAIVYPKFSVSWLPTDEDWFPRVPALDQLRLRAAWGWSGLQPPQNAAVLSYRPRVADTPGGPAGAVSLNTLGNPDLKPEKSREIEAGLDGDLLDGRLGLELTYYRKWSKDALLLRELPPSSGAPSARWENLASVENWGLEAGISATPLASPGVTWDLTLGGSVNHNKILEFGEGVSPPSENYREGYPGGSAWATSPIKSFKDENGDGIIAPDEVVIGEEEKFLGPMLPERQLSLHSGLALWNLVRISMLFEYRGGFVLQNVTEGVRCSQGYCRSNWDPQTPLREQARRVAPGWSGQWYEDGDFVKMREAGITLFVPEGWASRMGAERLSFTLTGRNLATWTDYTGNDPEVNSYGVESGSGGWENFDWNAQAPFRYFTARVNVGF